MKQTILSNYIILPEEVVQNPVLKQKPITSFFHKVEKEQYIGQIEKDIKKNQVFTNEMNQTTKRKPGRPRKKISAEINSIYQN